MGDVVRLDCWTKLPLPVEQVLDGAKKECEYVLVLGYDKEGKMRAYSSTGDMETAVYISHKFIASVMAGDFDE